MVDYWEAHAVRTPSRRGETVWEVADLYAPNSPRQGDWALDDYLAIDTNRIIEWADGSLDFPQPPTLCHQFIVENLASRFAEQLGRRNVLFHIPVRLNETLVRMPDLCHFDGSKVDFDSNQPLEGVRLVVEVLGTDPRTRSLDLVTKRREYARAGVLEYWIVDPENSVVTVLALNGDKYEQAGEYTSGQTAMSRLLPGLEIDVTEALSTD